MNHSIVSVNAAFVSLLLGSVPLLACSSSNGPPPPVAEADFNADYAEIVCSGSEKCCAIGKYPYDKAACVAEWRREYDLQPTAGLTYNAAYAGECIARVRSLMSSCDAPSPSRELGDLDFYCQNIYTGPRQPGEHCGKDEECAASPDGLVTCDAGVCKVTPTNHEGDACLSGNEVGDCGEVTGDTGLYCASDGHCRKKEAVGSACSTPHACDRTGYCSNGACVARGGPGTPCSTSSKCARDQHCVAGTCTPKKQPGEACDVAVDVCFDGTCSDGRCSSGEATAEFCAGRPSPTGG